MALWLENEPGCCMPPSGKIPRMSKLAEAAAKQQSQEVALVEIARACYQRGWVLGTSGNFSAVVARNPLVLTITSTGLDKGSLSADTFVHINSEGEVLKGEGRPSAEAALHLLLARERQAQAILHTHSIWSTILSDKYADVSGLAIHGYEMLKGLAGVKTHEHREWLPIFENDQDMARLAGAIGSELAQHPNAHGFLLRRHGLYTWGSSLEEARRHVEILEFLLEVLGRAQS